MTLTGILFKASLLLFAAVLAQGLFGKRLSATSRHLLWTLAIVGLLVLPVFVGVLPTWTVANVAPSRAAELARSAESTVIHLASEMTPMSAPAATVSNGQLAGVRVLWPVMAAVFYVIGALVLLLRLVAQRWSVRRLACRATRVTDPAWIGLLNEATLSLNLQRSVVLLRGVEETMPMAFGTRHPAILLPAVADTWSEEQRRSVLLHELAHVARYDCLTQSLAAVACAIYWIHPGVWWVARRLRIERELACDDRVLAAGTDAGDYASHLLEFAYSLRIDTASALAVTMAAPKSLEGRLRALLDSGRNRQTPALRRRATATAIAAALVGAIAAARMGGDIHVEAFAPLRVPLLQIQDPPRQSFEVASVKPNKSPVPGGSIQRRPGGNFSVGNQTMETLILFAFQIQKFQLIGAPDWIATERFDIIARAPADVPPTPFGATAPEALMLRSLLEDRFRLSVHRESRDLPIYALVLARADGRLGPRLRRPTSDFCARRFEAAAKGVDMPTPPGTVCNIRAGSDEVTAGAFPMNEFARFLSARTGRVVVDRTGLIGGWDFDLKWTPPDTPNPDPNRPSIFTALQEQLGLRLEATTGPVEVLVIDRLERLMPE